MVTLKRAIVSYLNVDVTSGHTAMEHVTHHVISLYIFSPRPDNRIQDLVPYATI
jgi:hypothetical protein